MPALVDSLSFWLVIGALFLLVFVAVLTIVGVGMVQSFFQNLRARLKISFYNNFQYNNLFSLTIDGRYYEYVCVEDISLMETKIKLLSDKNKIVTIPNYDFVKLYKAMHEQTLARAKKGD